MIISLFMVAWLLFLAGGVALHPTLGLVDGLGDLT
jgi:hypothetical protein